MTKHPLYTLAEQADARFSEVISSHTAGKRDRWTMTVDDLLNAEIRSAYRAKLYADSAWLAYMRLSSEQRTRSQS